MLFANVCAGFIRLCYGVGGKGAAWRLLVLLVVLLILEVLALPIYPLVCVEPGLRRRAYRWTRSSGGVR